MILIATTMSGVVDHPAVVQLWCYFCSFMLFAYVGSWVEYGYISCLLQQPHDYIYFIHPIMFYTCV